QSTPGATLWTRSTRRSKAKLNNTSTIREKIRLALTTSRLRRSASSSFRYRTSSRSKYRRAGPGPRLGATGGLARDQERSPVQVSKPVGIQLRAHQVANQAAAHQHECPWTQAAGPGA